MECIERTVLHVEFCPVPSPLVMLLSHLRINDSLGSQICVEEADSAIISVGGWKGYVTMYCIFTVSGSSPSRQVVL